MRSGILLLLLLVSPQDGKAPRTSKEAIGRLQFLVGEWKVIVEGEGAFREESRKWEFLFEKGEWALQFKVKDGARAKAGVLRYDPKKKVYRLEETRVNGKKVVYEGKPDERELVLEETAAKEEAAERLNWILLRDNRYIGSIERRRAGSKVWLESHQLQFTKKGVPFVRSRQPKCVVTGGVGTIEITRDGKTYLVCCNSCRKEFARDPEKTLAEARKEGWIK